MQNPLLKFRQSSIDSQKPGSTRAPTIILFNIFLLKFCTPLLLTNFYKRVSEIFLFCLENKIFWELLINLLSVRVWKSSHFLFWQINSMVVVACQKFQFSRQDTWFLKNKRALFEVLYGVLYYFISITKILKKSVHQSQFYINHKATLMIG